jgi:4-hydroxy-tetrahydrodipicolinate synthase
MPKPLTIGPVNAASPTPTLADGEIDLPSVPKLARHWIGLGLDGVMVLGTMGEGLVLSDNARNVFLQKALEAVNGRLTIFATAADLSRQRMIERARRYASMGADCIVLCVPPKVPVPKAIADVKATAEACPIPCAYYDIPENTGTNLVLSEMLDILTHPNIVACKDSSGNALIAQALTSAEFRPRVKLLHGNEYATVHSALLGYDGVLHGGGAITGRYVRATLDAIAAGNVAEAIRLDREKSLLLAQVYNRFSRPLQNVIGQKYVLHLLGAMDQVHAVEMTLSDADKARVKAAVDKHRAMLEAK